MIGSRIVAKLRRAIFASAAAAAALVLTSCTPTSLESPVTVAPQAEPFPIPVRSGVIAQNDRFVLYAPAPNDTLALLARRFLGSSERDFEIAKFNGITRAEPGRVLAIPLQPINPGGVVANGFQTVPILCYHRFGPQASKMIMAPDAFAEQLDYLARTG